MDTYISDERHYASQVGAVIIGHGSFLSTSQSLSNIKLLPGIYREIHDIYNNKYLILLKKKRKDIFNINVYATNFIEKVKQSYLIRSCPQEYLCINRVDPDLGPSDLLLKYAFFKGINMNIDVEMLKNCLRLLEIFFIAKHFKDVCTKYKFLFNLETLNIFLFDDVLSDKIDYLNVVYSRINEINSDFENIYGLLVNLFSDNESIKFELTQQQPMVYDFINLFIELDEMDHINCAKFQEFKPTENTEIKMHFFHENEYDGLYLYDIESDNEIHVSPNMEIAKLEDFRELAIRMYNRNKLDSIYNEFELFMLNDLIDMTNNEKYDGADTVSSVNIVMLLTLLNIKNVSLDLTCSKLGDNESSFDAREYIPGDRFGFGVRKINKRKNNLKKKKTVNKRKQTKKTKRRKSKTTYA